MKQQELIKDAEELITFGNGIENLVAELVVFFNDPHTKAEINSYIIERSLDKMFSKKRIDELLLRMLSGSTTYNSSLIKEGLFYDTSKFTLSNEFMLKLKMFTEKLFDYILFIKEEIGKLEYDDVVERDIALRRTVCKIKTIFKISNVSPLDDENIREMELEDDDNGYYMTVPFEHLIERAKKRVTDDFEWIMSTYDWTNRDRYSYVSDQKLKTLKNLIMYLDTFIHY